MEINNWKAWKQILLNKSFLINKNLKCVNKIIVKCVT